MKGVRVLRIKSHIILFVLLIAMLTAVSANAANRYINLTLRYDYADHKYNAEEVFVAIDDVKLTGLTMPPIILNGYTLVPAREVFEGVGANVEWKKDLEQVYVKYDDTLVVIPVNSSKAYVNGVSETLQTEAKIINNKTMIPLRFVTTALGFDIEWDKTTRIANIVTKKTDNHYNHNHHDYNNYRSNNSGNNSGNNNRGDDSGTCCNYCSG